MFFTNKCMVWLALPAWNTREVRTRCRIMVGCGRCRLTANDGNITWTNTPGDSISKGRISCFQAFGTEEKAVKKIVKSTGKAAWSGNSFEFGEYFWKAVCIEPFVHYVCMHALGIIYMMLFMQIKTNTFVYICLTLCLQPCNRNATSYVWLNSQRPQDSQWNRHPCYSQHIWITTGP